MDLLDLRYFLRLRF